MYVSLCIVWRRRRRVRVEGGRWERGGGRGKEEEEKEKKRRRRRLFLFCYYLLEKMFRGWVELDLWSYVRSLMELDFCERCCRFLSGWVWLVICFFIVYVFKLGKRRSVEEYGVFWVFWKWIWNFLVFFKYWFFF